MRYRPGRNLLWIAVGSFAVGLLGFAWPRAGWVALLPIVLALPFAFEDYRFLRVVLKQISVRREIPISVARDSRFPIALVIENAVPEKLAGQVRDLVPPEARPAHWVADVELLPLDETRMAYELRIAERGLHQFGNVWLRIQGRYGLLDAQRELECPGEVKVLPDAATSKEDLHKDALAEKRFLDRMTRTRLRGEGFEFESLHEYRHGDDPRRIDWRASARHSRMIVRRFQVEQHRDLMIVVDCGRLMGTDTGRGSKLDRAVDSALMLSRVALERGDRCGLGFFDDQVRGYLPPLSGPNALRTITESIYNLQSRWRESNFSRMFATLQTRQIKRALVVVLSDIVDADTSERFRAAMASLARKHVVVFAALQTPLLWRTLRAPVEGGPDVSRKAVVFRLLRERETVLHILKRTGIHVLDVAPDELTVPLVNRYLDLRDRNLL